MEDGRGEIDVQDHSIAGSTRFDLLGPTDQEGHPQGFFIHNALVIQAMFTEKKALVAGVHDDRVVSQAGLVQIVQNTTNVIIHTFDAAEVFLHVQLVLHLLLGFALKVLRLSSEIRVITPVTTDVLELFP
jgi:hypothetical protein